MIMFSDRLKALINVSVLYANPQVTDRLRKKGKTGGALMRSALMQYVWVGILFLFIYGLTMFSIDYSKYPGIFTSYVGIFALLGISQSVSVIYNVFFESKDLSAYLPLPFKQGQIFLSKMLVICLTVIPYLLPLLPLFFLGGFRNGINPVVSVIWAVLLFILLNLMIFSLGSIIVFGVTRTKLFKKHKKLMTTLMLWVTLAVAMVGILWMNSRTTGSGMEGGMTDSTVLPPFKPFYLAAAGPFAVNGLLSLLGIVAVTAALLLLIKQWLLPRLYEQLIEVTSTEGGAKKRHTEYKGLRKLLFNYNFELIKNPNLITQVISSTLVFPLVFAVSFAFSGLFNMSGVPLKMWGVFFVAGYVVAVMTINQISFVANIISLDGENYDFLRSLPMSSRTYLKEKFLLALAVQAVISGGTALVIGLVMRANLLLILGLILGSLLGAFVLCLLYFARDHRLLMTDWTNLNQLFNRGSGRFGAAFTMIGSWFGGGILIFIYAMAAQNADFAPLNPIVLLAVLAVSAVVIWLNKTSFWDKLDEVSWQRKIAIKKSRNKS